MDWQTLIVFIIVALTAGIFLRNMLKRGPKSGCGDGCGSGAGKVKRHKVIEQVIQRQAKDDGQPKA